MGTEANTLGKIEKFLAAQAKWVKIKAAHFDLESNVQTTGMTTSAKKSELLLKRGQYTER